MPQIYLEIKWALLNNKMEAWFCFYLLGFRLIKYIPHKYKAAVPECG